MKPLICEECKRKAGVVPYRSLKRTYCVYVIKSSSYPHKMLCQWCRAKESRN